VAAKSAGKAGALTDKAEQALRKIEKSNEFHDALVTRIRNQMDAYEGTLRDDSDAAQWQSQLHPPILNHLVETALSTLIEQEMAFKIQPAPRFYNPGEEKKAQDGGRAHEILMRQQMKQDRFNEFQRPFVLQAAICRLSVAKTYWRQDLRPRNRLEMVPVIPGVPWPVRLKKTTKVESCFDGPVTETVDLRDFYWHEAAVSLEKSRWCAHAIWMSEDDIQRLAKQGVYDKAAADEVQHPSDPAPDKKDDLERDREKRGRKKDMVEVLEIWDRETGLVTTIASRRVLLRQAPWPFWHNEYPFVTTSLAPFPFSLQGLSLVEKLVDLQSSYWDLLNQTIDSNRFINNAMYTIASDLDDPENFDPSPGAVNIMERPDQVQMFKPEIALATVAMPMMQQLQQHMQDLAMGQPFAPPLSGRVTATEMSLLTNIAQQQAAGMKNQLFYAYQRIGHQRVQLNQQFIRQPIYVDQIGLDQATEVLEVLPEILQGDYLFDVSPMSENMMRSEKRSEAQGLFQLAVQSAPVMAAVGQPWNMQAFGDKLLEGWGIEDTAQFYSAKPQQPQGPPGQPGQPGQGGPPQQEGPGGVTAPQSIAPEVSPSNQASIAPSVFNARAQASQGGIVNGGGQ
jgi:hypothetical protein